VKEAQDMRARFGKSSPVIPGALIVAAGYSSRMGRFKPLLPFGSATVVECAINAFRLAGIVDISVVVGHNAELLTSALDRLGVAWTLNQGYQGGMLSSVAAGVAALPVTLTGCFFLPGDMPLVRPSTLARMIESASCGETPVCYPTFRGERGHPPLIASTLFSEILAGGPSDTLRDILNRHEFVEVPVFDRGILLDMDTPEEYEVLEKRAGQGGIPDDDECLAMLEHRNLPGRVIRHSRAVADVAEVLTAALNGEGLALDARLVRAGAWLHDIAKGTRNHAAVGARIVGEFGFPAVAGIVAAHCDLDFSSGVIDETAVVHLADKLVREDRLVPLVSRFKPGLDRFAPNSEAAQAVLRRWATAQSIASAVERALGQPAFEYLCLARPDMTTETETENAQ